VRLVNEAPPTLSYLDVSYATGSNTQPVYSSIEIERSLHVYPSQSCTSYELNLARQCICSVSVYLFYTTRKTLRLSVFSK